jgi:hypothetical protein
MADLRLRRPAPGQSIAINGSRSRSGEFVHAMPTSLHLASLINANPQVPRRNLRQFPNNGATKKGRGSYGPLSWMALTTSSSAPTTR